MTRIVIEEEDDDGKNGNDDDSDQEEAENQKARAKKMAWKRRRTVAMSAAPVLPYDEVFDAIKKIPSIANNLNEGDIKTLSELVKVKQFEPYADVLRFGQPTSELLMVHKGSCKVSVPSEIKTLNPGDFIYETVLSKGSVQTTQDVSAGGDGLVTVLSIAYKDVEKLGLQRKLGRKKKRSGSRCIARPEMPQESGGNTTKCTRRSLNVDGSTKQRGRLATEAPAMPDFKSVPKSNKDKKFIMDAVRANSHLIDLLQLTDLQVEEISKCVTLMDVESGVPVIQKGEKGDAFYMIANGVFEILIDPDPHDPAKNRDGLAPIRIVPGQSFGELALLYDSPRKATVVAANQASLWVLELSQWRCVLKMRPASRIETYMKLVSGIPEFANREKSELRRLADALDEVYFMSGEEVVAEGADGDTMYVILDGLCAVTKGGISAGELKAGDFLGESVLLKDDCYDAGVIVISETATILALDKVTLNLIDAREDEARSASRFEGIGDSSPMPRRRSLLRAALGDSDTNGKAQEQIPLDRLERICILGTGSFAYVSLEKDLESGKLWALKAMSKAAIVDQGLKNMVLGEKKALMEVDSAFVISMVATYQDKSTVYFLMVPCLGGELFDLFNKNEHWFSSAKHAVFFTVCIALGLESMHAKKIIHRDIKLENILLDMNGYARISDLGLAKTVVGKTYTVCGTADYLAPETLKQVGHNRAVDWWAVGVLAFVMMSGRSPFDAEDVMQIYRNIVKGFRKEMFPLTFDPNLVDFIKGMCRKKPQERITMVPGGVKNLKTHPWLTAVVTWEAVSAMTHPTPYVPEAKTMEDWKKEPKKDADVEFKEYNDDGSGWDTTF